MVRGKSADELKQEWGAVSRDWYSVYQWKRLRTAAYSERIAALILDDYQEITLNVQGLREYNYRLPDHRGQYQLQTSISQFQEKRFVRAMYNLGHSDSLGRMLDYEVPLKAYRSAPHGDIDLLTLDGRSLLIIEVKQHGSRESLLRAFLQAYTYARLVHEVKDRLTRAFALEASVELVPAVLTFTTAQAGKQLRAFARYPRTRALLDRLDRDLIGRGLGETRFYLNTDSEAALRECLTANPSDLGGHIITFREGFVPRFRRVLA